MIASNWGLANGGYEKNRRVGWGFYICMIWGRPYAEIIVVCGVGY